MADIMHLSWGISWKGVWITALLMLPNILYMLLPKTNVPPDVHDGSLFITILEQVSRILYFTLVIATTRSAVVSYSSPLLFIMLGSLIIYYLLWVRYFVHGMDFRYLFDPVLHIPMPMAVFPILFLLFSALWLKSIPSTIAAILFAAGHLSNSYFTYKQSL